MIQLRYITLPDKSLSRTPRHAWSNHPSRSPFLFALSQTAGDSGNKGQLFLQQAETVRLISPTTSGESDAGAWGEVGRWRPLSVTDIEGGEALLLREASRGTHVGKAIDAVVTES